MKLRSELHITVCKASALGKELSITGRGPVKVGPGVTHG